jgi:hypothetical protein
MIDNIAGSDITDMAWHHIARYDHMTTLLN